MALKLDDIDVYSPDNYIADVPHDMFKYLRQHAPVYRHPHPDGGFYWLLTKHADCLQVSRDHKTFSSNRGFVMLDDLAPDILKSAQGQLLGMDPPGHGPIRRLVITRFTGKILEAMEVRIRALVKDIFTEARRKPECDFVYDVVAKLPTGVIADMMGIPREDWDRFRDWSDKQTAGDDPDINPDPENITRASVEMGMYGYQLATERTGKHGSDLISLLVNVEVDGHKVNAEEFASLFVQVSVAGNETTRTLISGGMLELMKRPELYRELEAKPQLIPSAVEEMLRHVCPLHYFRRTAVRDAEIRGKQIKEGDRIVMLYASANRDEDVFANPDEFDIHRDPNPHLAFGYGIHLCLGANLARMEARVFFEEFFNTFSGIELIGEPRRLRSNLINGMKEMPVRLHWRDGAAAA